MSKITEKKNEETKFGWYFKEDFMDSLFDGLSDEWIIFFRKKEIYVKLEEAISKIFSEQELFEGHLEIFPPPNWIFNAIKCISPQEIKAVIIGQDPYHQPNQAMGLSFSVPKNVKIPPSLINIYKELETDIDGWEAPKHGELTKWKEQKVNSDK